MDNNDKMTPEEEQLMKDLGRWDLLDELNKAVGKSRIDIIGQNGNDGEHYNQVDTKNFDIPNTSNNNGGATDYYKLKPEWKDGMDIIEDRGMNYSQGNILKVAMTFNLGRHEGTNYERELNKIKFFADRELNRIRGK
jgi:hypothetical protein